MKQDEVIEPLLSVTPLFASVQSVQKGSEINNLVIILIALGNPGAKSMRALSPTPDAYLSTFLRVFS